MYYTLRPDASIEILSTTDPFSTYAVRLEGNELANIIYGNASGNPLSGGAGDDMLYGYNGNDSLSGGSGANVLTGGPGNDEYYVEDFRDVVWEVAGEGNDRVTAGVDFALPAGSSVETLAARNPIGVELSIDLRGNELDNAIMGNNGDNVLNGDAGNDTLYGYSGDDVLVGGAGADLMEGGSYDNDSYYVDNAGDVSSTDSLAPTGYMPR